MPAAPPLKEPPPLGPSHPPFSGLERTCQKVSLTLCTAGRGAELRGDTGPAGRKWACSPSAPPAPGRAPQSHTPDGPFFPSSISQDETAP